MIETDVTTILNKIKLFGRTGGSIKDSYKTLIDGQNGVHPMNERFFLVSAIDEYNLGTATKTLTTREDKWEEDGVKMSVWHMNQPKAYEVRISLQGLKDKDLRGFGIPDIMEVLKLQMNTPKVRKMFSDIGYSYEIDNQTIALPMSLNTDQYVRYSFKVTFKTNISYEIEQEVLDKIEVEGKFIDDAKNVISEYVETVDENTIIKKKGE